MTPSYSHKAKKKLIREVAKMSPEQLRLLKSALRKYLSHHDKMKLTER